MNAPIFSKQKQLWRKSFLPALIAICLNGIAPGFSGFDALAPRTQIRRLPITTV
jgi:hypothetical protein